MSFDAVEELYRNKFEFREINYVNMIIDKVDED